VIVARSLGIRLDQHVLFAPPHVHGPAQRRPHDAAGELVPIFTTSSWITLSGRRGVERMSLQGWTRWLRLRVAGVEVSTRRARSTSRRLLSSVKRSCAFVYSQSAHASSVGALRIARMRHGARPGPERLRAK